MRLTAALIALGVALGLAALWAFGLGDRVAAWAAAEQRALQNELARLVTALRQDEPGALGALMLAAFGYGVAHAAGPGHGKFLIGGAALGGQGRMARWAAVALAAALAQGAVAILLVYGGLGLVGIAAKTAVDLTDDVLTPLSHAAVLAVGLVLVWRGARALRPLIAPAFARAARPAMALAGPAVPDLRSAVPHPAEAGSGLGSGPGSGQDARAQGHRHHGHNHHLDHDEACGCGHAHAPSAEAVAAATTLRDLAALVAAVALRPCTGAVILLVLAWRFDLLGAGALAVLAMALGTAAVTAAVAAGGVWVRRASLVAAGGARLRLAAGALQLGAGAAIAGLAGLFLAQSLG